MNPRVHSRRPGHASRVNLLISLAFHSVLVGGLTYFAAREGLLGKQIRKIAVEMVRERPPEKQPEPEKPSPEPPRVDVPKAEAPRVIAPPAPAARSEARPGGGKPPPAAVAPPAAELSAFVFEGGKPVETSADPVVLYKNYVEFALRSNWNRPVDMEDREYVAEVEVAIDRTGRLEGSVWKRGSGHARWDGTVRAALAATPRLDRVPPAGFPGRVLVRFDVVEENETAVP